jgi:malate synthase
LYQYARHKVTTFEGTKVTGDVLLGYLRKETQKLAAKAPKGHKFDIAAKYFAGQLTGEEANFQDFLTTMLYDEILDLKSGGSKL